MDRGSFSSRTARAIGRRSTWPFIFSVFVGISIFFYTNFSCINWDQHVRHRIAPNKYVSRPGRPDVDESVPCLRNAFKEILLVIVYNYPYYNSIQHFKDFYKPAFPNMVFCGPLDKKVSGSVMTVDVYRGLLGYECLGKAIRQNPGYEGYFYINDDVILNYWNFYDFDKASIWQSPNVFYSTPMYGAIQDKWYWWRSNFGLPSCRQAYEHLSNISFGQGTLGYLEENSNGSLRCFSGRSDVLYVPKKHAQTFSVLSFIFYNHRVFLEIAVPTILRVIEKQSNIKQLPGYYIPGDVRKQDKRVTDSRFFWFIYFTKKENWFIHPFKLHQAKLDSNFNFIMLRYFLIQKTKSLTTCQNKTKQSINRTNTQKPIETIHSRKRQQKQQNEKHTASTYH